MGILRDLNTIAKTGNESLMIQFLSDESNRSTHSYRTDTESFESAVRKSHAKRCALRHNQEIAYAALVKI